jgi:hypothetical protein
MATNEELDRRVAAIEGRLGMDVEPPLDRLSGIEFKIDGLRELMNYQGLTQGEHSKALRVLQTDVTKIKADLAETKAGVEAILALLTNPGQE